MDANTESDEGNGCGGCGKTGMVNGEASGVASRSLSWSRSDEGRKKTKKEVGESDGGQSEHLDLLQGGNL